MLRLDFCILRRIPLGGLSATPEKQRETHRFDGTLAGEKQSQQDDGGTKRIRDHEQNHGV